MEDMGSRSRFKPLFLPLILIFVLMTIVITLSGVAYYQDQKRNFEIAARNQLDAISALKAQQISAWIGERRANAEMVMSDAYLISQVGRVLTQADNGESRAYLLDLMRSNQAKYQYQDVLLLDVSAQTVLSASGAIRPPGRVLPQLVSAAIAQRNIVFSDIYRDENSESIFLDFVVPVFERQRQEWSPLGAIVLRSDADRFLYPFVASWPIDSASAETLLMRRDGDRALFLTNLRHLPGTALSFSLPLDASPLTDLRGLESDGRIVAGMDYRGVAALAELRPVQGTPWVLETKIDQGEIYAPLEARARYTLTICVVMILASGTATLLLWRERELKFKQYQEREKLERQALIVHYQHLTKFTHDIILLLDQEWNILSANDRATSAYGRTEEKLLGLRLQDLHAPEARDSFNRYREELQTRGDVTYETLHMRRNRTRFPVECTLRVLQIENHRFYQAVIRDITEQKHAEQELRESEKRFRLFYEQAPISYQALSEDGTIKDVNWAWCELLGYRRDEVIGRKFVEFLTPDSVRQFHTAFQGYKLVGEISGAEYAMRCDDGSTIYVNLVGKVGFDEAGEVKLVHCVLYDITVQKETEDRIRRLNEELEQRVIERTTQLEAANKELEAFSYSVSHDLRAPLRAIDGFSRILQEEFAANLPEEAVHYLKIICENTAGMARLIDDLLVFSRLSRQPLKLETVDPAVLIAQSLEVLQPDYKDRKIEFVLNDLPPCQADPTLLKQVFMNLLSNAIKFTRHKPDACVEVGSLHEDGHVIYYVKDNGVGFDMQYAPKLFGVFQRLHRVEEYEGTGVGLAIVQRIIHRHGGRVWAEGVPNQGATFCFTLGEEQARER